MPVIDAPLISIVFAPMSGNTQYVVDSVVRSLAQLSPRWRIAAARAETTEPEDLRNSDLLVLASGTWNTGGSEGQLNPLYIDVAPEQGQPCGSGRSAVCVH